MYNSSRGITVEVTIRFAVLQNEKNSALLPVFAKPEWNIDGENNVYKCSEIRLSGACLGEVFP